MNSDTSQPFWVMVRRLGPHGKGLKFFCGAPTKNAATAIAGDQNNRELEDASRRDRPQQEFEYTVQPKPDHDDDAA